MKHRKVSIVDLFCGIGGMRMGAERALGKLSIPHETALACDIDAYARETYRRNFCHNPLSDIREIEKLPETDIILAGFPCQPFSYAGHRQGFADKRGTLFFEVERLVVDSMPSIVILENVKGLVSHDHGRTLETILSTMISLGYKVDAEVLNSSDFGVPQNRDRLFITCILSDEEVNYSGSPIERKNKTVNLSGILEKEPMNAVELSFDFVQKIRQYCGGDMESLSGSRLTDLRGGNSIHSWDLSLRGECSSEEKKLMEEIMLNRRRKKYMQRPGGSPLSMHDIKRLSEVDEAEKKVQSLLAKGYLRKVDGRYAPVMGNMSFEVFIVLDKSKPSITLTASDCNRIGVVQNDSIRRLSVRECARLQGIEDSFIFPDPKRAYKQIGNSVSVPVVEAVIDRALKLCDLQ